MSTSKPAIEILAVGVGQGGGNLAGEFYRRGYRALAFNTATTDLTSLAQSLAPLPSEFRHYIGLKGYDGAGSDIAYGQKCIRTGADTIRDHVAKHAGSADLLLLTASLGGGTGSAVAELVRVLADLSIPMLVLATLPTDHESGLAKVNAVRAINDLVEETGIGIILIDNSRLADAHGGVSFDRYYTEINRIIAEPLDAFNRLNARSDISAIRSLDGEDFRTLLLSNGLLSFAHVTLSSMRTEAVMDGIREQLLANDIQPSGFKLEDMAYLAAVIEAPEHLLCDTPFTFYQRLCEQLKQETRGAAIFLGVYRTAAPQANATLRVLASSHALPEGVARLLADAKREGGELRAKLQRAPSLLALGDLEDFQLFGGAGTRRRIALEPAPTSSLAAPCGSPALDLRARLEASERRGQ